MSKATYPVAGVDVGKDTMHVVALDQFGVRNWGQVHIVCTRCLKTLSIGLIRKPIASAPR